jgi:hypothetical protein
MQSEIKKPEQAFWSPPMTLPVESPPPVTHHVSLATQGTPPDICTTCKSISHIVATSYLTGPVHPREYYWNLSGYQEPDDNVLPEELCYGGIPAALEFKGNWKQKLMCCQKRHARRWLVVFPNHPIEKIPESSDFIQAQSHTINMQNS